jgi:hypothetical protein
VTALSDLPAGPEEPAEPTDVTSIIAAKKARAEQIAKMKYHNRLEGLSTDQLLNAGAKPRGAIGVCLAWLLLILQALALEGMVLHLGDRSGSGVAPSDVPPITLLARVFFRSVGASLGAIPAIFLGLYACKRQANAHGKWIVIVGLLLAVTTAVIATIQVVNFSGR